MTSDSAAADTAPFLANVIQGLSRVSQDLPAALQDEVWSSVQAAISSTAADLIKQCSGGRLLLLQSASIRRATQLTPLLKEKLVVMAQTVQQRRAELVKVLQRQHHQREKRRQGGSGNSSTANGGSPYEATWGLIRQAMAVDTALTYLVDAALCPSPAAFASFLEEAVVRRQLHRQVTEEHADLALAAASPERSTTRSERASKATGGDA